MATTVKEVTWLYSQLGIPVQFSTSYKMQLTCFWLSGDKNLSLRTGERHLLHGLVFLFASTGQDFKLSNTHGVTERTVCTWVTSKLTYWYIRDVCSVASRVKGYQALPHLTVHRRRAGIEPGNKARGEPFSPLFGDCLVSAWVKVTMYNSIKFFVGNLTASHLRKCNC